MRLTQIYDIPCAQGGGLLLSTVIQYILYNNWQRVGGSCHLERYNPCHASLYTLYVSVNVCVQPAATNRYSVIYSRLVHDA